MNEAKDDFIFPIYRKYKHGRNYFKINSKNQFEEFQIIGSKKIHHVIDAKQFPELNFIIDLIKINFNEIEISDEIEFIKSLPK
jgi:hypothetical protein